jgi:hypothetical protein
MDSCPRASIRSHSAPGAQSLLLDTSHTNALNKGGPITVEQTCAPLGSVQTRTTLYFGLRKPGGAISEAEWRLIETLG